MNQNYRLNKDNLLDALADWDRGLAISVLVVACGGTALTLQGYKESTKDVDFLVPFPAQFKLLLKFLENSGYKRVTGYGYKHPEQPWIFDLFSGQTIFQTELLDPVHEPGNHKVVKIYDKLTLGCLNSEDLIISKMFRGTQVDVQDSVLLIKKENLDLESLAERYQETASYYYNSQDCKKNLKYLIDELREEGIDSGALKSMSDKWTP